MADNPKESLVEWLQEAHAFARHGETMLSGRADALEGDYPELSSRLHQHVEETRAHATELEALLESLGASASGSKDIGARISAIGHSWATQVAGETPIKSTIAAIAFEHFEIANYRAMIVAADAADATQTQATLEGLIADDVAMADWLENVLTDVTRKSLGVTQR